MLHLLFVVHAALLGSCLASLQKPIAPHQSLHDNSAPTSKRVAIIGAGSAGTSAAYFLRNFTSSLPLTLNITIFERSPYIGGRSTTVDAYDDPTQPVELGASIFVSANRNLVAAVQAFNLSVGGFGVSPADDDDDDNDYPDTLGIWDGLTFIVTQTLSSDSRLSSWWSTAKILWRYGIASPLRARRLTASVVSSFLKLYDAPVFPFHNLTAAAQAVQLAPDVTGMTGAKFLAQAGISAQFASEIVQASTRVNYAQNLDQIHGLETAVCLAIDGAMSVAGGNWQIFAGMARHSGADVKLGVDVVGIERLARGRYKLRTKDVNGDPNQAHHEHTYDHESFDAVILAAPYHAANIALTPPLARSSIPVNVTYVTLHVTLLATPFLLSPSFFHLLPTTPVPRIVLTTLPSLPNAGSAKFWSVSTLRGTRNPRTGEREWLYKIFSPERVDEGMLRNMFGLPTAEDRGNDDDADRMGRDNERPEGVSWLYRKAWQSYPYLPPRTEFDAVCLDCETEHEADDGGYGGAFYYTSGIEPFISTMETSSLSGMNVARLLVDDWLAHGKSVTNQLASGMDLKDRASQNRLIQDW